MENIVECCSCRTLVPYNQLYVCLEVHCKHSLRQYQRIRNPHQFFKSSDVFCGFCTFYGAHKTHQNDMHDAEMMAINIASQEIGPQIDIHLKRVLSLDEENPVDKAILEETNGEQFEQIKFTEYLSASISINEWHEKVDKIHEFIDKINKKREKTNENISQLAMENLISLEQLLDICSSEIDEKGGEVDAENEEREEKEENEEEEANGTRQLTPYELMDQLLLDGC